VATSQAAQAQRLQVLGLQYEYLQALGVQHSAPTLSWQLRADQRNVTQTAYRILVSDTR
jgi:hypothetical protein